VASRLWRGANRRAFCPPLLLCFPAAAFCSSVTSVDVLLGGGVRVSVSECMCGVNVDYAWLSESVCVCVTRGGYVWFGLLNDYV